MCAANVVVARRRTEYSLGFGVPVEREQQVQYMASLPGHGEAGRRVDAAHFADLAVLNVLQEVEDHRVVP